MTNQPLSPWNRFINLLRLEKKDIAQIFYYAVFAGLVALSLPLGIQAIINLVQGAQISTSWIVLVALVTFGVIFSGILQFMQLRIIENIQQRIFTRASFELSYRFPKMEMEELNNVYPPELANRFFDTLTIQKGLSKILIDVPFALIQILFAIILLSFYHPFFILFGALLILLIYAVFQFTVERGLETSLEESKNKYKVAFWIQEIARNTVSFKLSGKTSLALDKNDSLVMEYLKAREKHFRILVLQFFQMIGFKVLVTAGLLIIGGLLVLNQEMNIGQFVASEIIILLVIASVEKLILGLEPFYDVLTSIEKLGQVVDKKMEPQNGSILNLNKNLTIELNNVSYTIPNSNKPILKNLNFKYKRGENLLIQGENLSGKSSLLQMLAGVISPTSGGITVNNLDINSINLSEYRANLGLSLIEESAFTGTIQENISFGDKNISNEDILWAIEKVGLLPYLKEQPDGLQTIIHSKGKQISHNVVKKIVLARAIVKKPKVLIIEDTLDQFNRAETNGIIDFLADKSNDWSLIVVSSKKHWLQHCDTLLKLEDGKIKSVEDLKNR